MARPIIITKEEIEYTANKVKDAANKTSGDIFEHLIQDSINSIFIQPVPYCDVGCLHCHGCAVKEKHPVLQSNELHKYINGAMNIAQEQYCRFPPQLCFSGLYGDPFCGFGEENSVDYYLDLIKTALNFKEILNCSFVTSGAHIKNSKLWETFLKGVKNIENEKLSPLETNREFHTRIPFSMNFSIDNFHGKKVPQEQIINAIKIMRNVYKDKDEQDFRRMIYLIGQTALSPKELTGGKEYLKSFIKKLESNFDNSLGNDYFRYRINDTGNGRVESTKEKYQFSMSALTKSKNGDLIISHIYNKQVRQYPLYSDKDGNLDKDNLSNVIFNIAYNKLTLNDHPILAKKDEYLPRRYILLQETIDSLSPEDRAELPKYIRDKGIHSLEF